MERDRYQRGQRQEHSQQGGLKRTNAHSGRSSGAGPSPRDAGWLPDQETIPLQAPPRAGTRHKRAAPSPYDAPRQGASRLSQGGWYVDEDATLVLPSRPAANTVSTAGGAGKGAPKAKRARSRRRTVALIVLACVLLVVAAGAIDGAIRVK